MRDLAGGNGSALWVWLLPPVQASLPGLSDTKPTWCKALVGMGTTWRLQRWIASSGDFSFFLALPCVSSLIKMSLLGNLLALVKRSPDHRAATPIKREDVEGDTKTTSDSQEFPLRCAVQLMAVATRAPWLVSLQKRSASCLSPPVPWLR